MSYVLGYPLVQGNSDEVVTRLADPDQSQEGLIAGAFVSQALDGFIAPVQSGGPIIGVKGQTLMPATACDVLLKGLSVPLRLKEGDKPNGSHAFLDEQTGFVSSSGTIKVGVFCDGNVITAFDPDTQTQDPHCCLVNVDIKALDPK
jgi:hypothetical protein